MNRFKRPLNRESLTCLRMRGGKMNKIVLAVLLNLQVCIVCAKPEIYFGEDVNPNNSAGTQPDRPGRIDFPNSKAARDLFWGRLINPLSETFESFSSGVSPDMLHFGDDTATFTGDPYVLGPEDYFPDNTMNGVWPTSGNKCLLQHNALGNTFQINFSSPQAVLGFYATDLETADLTITLHQENGQTADFVVNYTHGFSGSVVFFGIIDTEKPFIKAVFSRTNNNGDGFGFDDMIIGRIEQVCLYKVLGDLNADCKVNLADLAIMAGNWLVDCTIEPVPSSCISLL